MVSVFHCAALISFDPNDEDLLRKTSFLPDIMDDASSIVKMHKHQTGGTHIDFIFDIIKHGIE